MGAEKHSYRPPIRLRPLSGGLNDAQDQTSLLPAQTPNCLNVEFDQGDVRTTGGSIKFNNQTAPHAGLRTRVDPALSPLSIAAGKSVPLRGYGYIPYSAETDIGGDFGASGFLPGQAFHGRRGRSFTRSIGFMLPPEERLYGRRPGASSGEVQLPADANVLQFIPLGGYDEALDECTVVWQKGGDRAPMSVAFGIVNVGDKFEYITGAGATERPSNYALVFMWYDAAEWAAGGPTAMRYKVGTGAQPDVAINGTTCSLAYRAIIAKAWIEPGKPYVATVELKLDSGTTGGNVSNPSANWVGDGTFKIVLQDTASTSATICSTLNTDLFVWKGPSDSYDYLTRYGVRFSGRDATFLGMGQRFMPHASLGFIPFGFDSAAMERAGHSMVAVSDVVAPTGTSLLCSHTSGDSFVSFNHRALFNGNTNGGVNPLGPSGTFWTGLGDGSGAIYNADALRNYHVVIWNQATTQINGLRLKVGTYSEVGASYRLDCGVSSSTLTWANKLCSIQAFRWNQRELVLQDFRLYNGQLDYTDPRTLFSLRAMCDPNDATDPNVSKLVSCHPLDDAGGGVLRELVAGRSGFTAPFGLGIDTQGDERRLFLSGEGEALCLDFSSDPVLRREAANMLRGGYSGFAVEVTCELPEAIYAIDESAGSAITGKYAPNLFTWEIQDPEGDGYSTQPYPLLELTHRCIWSTFTTPVRRPMGFMARVSTNSDQETGAWSTIVTNWEVANGFYWDESASWVGRRITFQVGIQSTGTADSYVAYVAFLPKTDLAPNGSAGDAAQLEATYFTGTTTIKRRDLLRSVITIGGSFDPKAAGEATLGYSELNARMIVRQVRVYGASAPGGLPATSGTAITSRNGKLSGDRCLPNRPLNSDDILRPVGPALVSVNVTEGSTSVSPSGQSRFFTNEARESIEAVKHTYMAVLGDKLEIRDPTTGVYLLDEFYWVADLAAGGSALTIGTSFHDATRKSAAARSFRLIGYTDFRDDVSLRALTLGRGTSFVPGTTTTRDVVMSEDYFVNGAPVSKNWKLRVYSPIGQSSTSRLIPRWTRGVKIARRNPVLGLHNQDARLYATTKGCLYEVDDRWRDDGPTDAITTSLAFHNTRMQGLDVWFPRQRDHVRFASPSAVAITASISGFCYVYDAWVWIGDTVGIQTILWAGSELTDPMLTAGSHRAHLWIRINNGRPEFCLGSTATYSGTLKPEKGLYIATGSTRLQARTWTHVRWYVGEQASGTQIEIPKLKVNGRTSNVAVNTWASAYSGSSSLWLDTSTLVQPGSGGVLLMGAARDASLLPRQDAAYTQGVLNGLHMQPNYVQGLMHGFGGKLAGVVVSREAASVGDSAADFDPNSITYTTQLFAALNPDAQAVGHKVLDSAGAQYGVIYSHPFISLFHELGVSTEPTSFTTYENAVYLANGGRPVFIEGDRAGFVGVLQPTTAPSFTIERKPLWVENSFSAGIAENDPIAGSATGTTPVFHFQSLGNTYWKQAYSSSLKWTKDTYFAYACLFKPWSVVGRIPIWSSRDGLASGSAFIELREGRVFVGWWDTELKQEVTISTNVPVVIPGYSHYLDVRILHPNSAPSGVGWPNGFGGWWDSIFEETAAYTRCKITVRRFMKEAATASFSNYPTFAAKTNGTTRNAISFTTDLEYAIAGCTATGLVTGPSKAYTGAAGGIVNVGGAPFHADMVGMIWQWGNAGDSAIYRIAAVAGAGNQITVVNAAGANPDFSGAGYTAKSGGVFTGVRLIKSDNYSSARNPDEAAYDFERFGSHVTRDDLAGLSPFTGEWYSEKVYVVTDTDGQNVDIFENDRPDEIETGSDLFEGPIYTGATAPNELVAVAGNVFSAINTRPAAGATTPTSSQPNEELRIDLDAESSALADPVYWQYVEDVEVLAAQTQVRVTFYDPDQDVVSNAGPAIAFTPSGEDKHNPSAQARILLTNIPVSRESDRMQRRIYMTLANGATFFEVAEIPDNESSSISLYLNQKQITARPQGILEWDNAPPPPCYIVAASQNTIVYAALADQQEAYRWSTPYFPASVPYGNFDIFATGRSNPITAAADLKGHLILFKRDAMRKIVLRDGVVIPDDITTGVGAVARGALSSLDNRLYFRSDRGIYAYSGAGLPVWVTPTVSDLFTEDSDKRYVTRASASINRGRNQYTVTARIAGDPDTRDRISCEFDHELSGSAVGSKLPSLHRVSRNRWPRVTALGALDRRGGGLEQHVAGTEEGFAVYLDRGDSKRVMLGATSALWGSASATAGTGSTTSKLVLSGSPSTDIELEGARGSPVSWLDGSTLRTGVYLTGNASNAWLDRAVTGGAPVNGAALTIGAMPSQWETTWLDMGTPWAVKKIRYLDIVFSKALASGSIEVEVYTDLNEVTVYDRKTIDTATMRSPFTVNPDSVIECKFLKVKLYLKHPTVDARMVVTEIVVRLNEDQQP